VAVAEKLKPAASRLIATRASEWRFVILVILGLLVVTSIPYVYGYLTAPTDLWFSGVIYNVHDTAQYLSWMRESGHRLFIDNKLTSEPNEAVFLNLHWWIPGRLAAITGLSLTQVYQIFRVCAVPLLTVATYAFCALLFEDLFRRRFAFLLSILTSGLGWVWVVRKQFTGHLSFPLDVYTTPGNSFYVMMVSPPQAFAAALTLVILLLAVLGVQRKRFWLSVAAALSSLFLGLGHIYDLVTVWAVLAVFGLLLTLRDGWSWATFWRLFVVVLLSAPAAAYYGYVSSSASPVWQQALAQYDNLGVFTPGPAHLLILLGLTFLLAWLGFFSGMRSWRVQSDLRLFIKGWFLVTLVLVYLPLHFQVMLLTGYQLPMAVLATVGLFDHILPWIQDRLSHTRWRHLLTREWFTRVIPTLVLLAVIPTNLYLLAWRAVDLNRHDYPYYLHRDDVAAMHWLDEHTAPDDVVLSSFTIGHYIPGLAGNRAFLANAVMTMDFNHKREMTDAFFDAATPDDERLAMTQKYGIRYVFSGPAERRLGDYDPATAPWLALAFSTPQVDVYSVQMDKLPVALGSGDTP
jgi:hypothetical protein